TLRYRTPFNSIRELEVLGGWDRSNKIDDSSLLPIISSWPWLENINLSWTYSCFSDAVLIAIGACSKNLKSINVHSTKIFSDSGMTAVVQDCPLLESIDFSATEKC